MEVQLNPLFGKQETPVGPVDTEVPSIWRVDVVDERLKGEPLFIASGKLHVGMIGRQVGANFCANSNFGQFAPTQKDHIVAEVKRLHGSADLTPPVELPEPIEPEEDDEDEDFDDLDDTDTIED